MFERDDKVKCKLQSGVVRYGYVMEQKAERILVYLYNHQSKMYDAINTHISRVTKQNWDLVDAIPQELQ